MDANPLTAGWRNARAPVQTAANGRVNVAIEQTGEKAILNWETFNVGRNTTVQFRQDPNWAVLNRVNDPKARPSQIQGQIKADGTVMIVNRNGVVFDGSAQVNVRNLVAAATRLSDEQFQNNGLYSADGKTPNFTDALGKIELRPGAVIETSRPSTVTQSGGYVLLLGREVDNAGTITTPKGQAALAAGDNFVIKRGQGTEGNVASTTRGNDVTASGEGTVRNRGLILSPLGDITLAARQVEQAGVLASTTSVDARGTIHLNGVGADGAVTLRSGSTTAILVDLDGATALDGQRDALMPASLATGQTLGQTDPYRRDLSLVQVESGGTVDFQGDSLTLATGGQVGVKAGKRTLVRDGAQIDVSGAIGVAVSMESNNLKINVQGNEQRDAPMNRDSGKLNNGDIWLDRRELIRVASGSGGYDGDRWYSGGGLLEVGGYLGTMGVPVSHWLAQGGQVRFEGAEVVTQKGSSINLSGGTLDVRAGTLQQTWLRGADGRLYVADKAPATCSTPASTKATSSVPRAGARRPRAASTTRCWRRAPATRTATRSAATPARCSSRPAAPCWKAIWSATPTRARARTARRSPGWTATASRSARRAPRRPGGRQRCALLRHGLAPDLFPAGATGDTVAEVVLGAGRERVADGLTWAPPCRRKTRASCSWTRTSSTASLGRLRVAAGRSITVDAALRGADGGEITLYAPDVDVKANLTSRGGLIQAGNVLYQPSFLAVRLEDSALAPAANQKARLHVSGGVMLDARGVWANLLRDADGLAGLPVRDGGRIALRGTGDVAVDAGSVLDVTAGASLVSDGKLQGGKGGNVTLASHVLGQIPSNGGLLSFAGEVRGYGVTGGGTLSVASGGKIVLGGP